MKYLNGEEIVGRNYKKELLLTNQAEFHIEKVTKKMLSAKVMIVRLIAG